MSERPEVALLTTFTGQDRPGLTAAIFSALERCDVTVIDVEQVVIRENLILGVLVDSSADEVQDVLADVAVELGLDVDFELSSEPRVRRTLSRHHVTVVGDPLRPAALAGLADLIAAHEANIDRITRLAAYPVTALELIVSAPPDADLRTSLAAASARLGVDVAVERAGLYRRGKRLIVMDVDSTLVQGEVIEMLAARAGCLDRVAAVTEAAMRGELDFATSLRERVALLEGLDAGALDEVRDELQLARGARTLVRTLKRLGYVVGIVSGGFTQITEPLAETLGIGRAVANTLEVVDGRLTGRIVGPVVDRAGKAEALARFAAAEGLPLAQTVAIGDGANDLDMLARAGLGIAYNAKPVVRDAADAALSVPYLDAVLFLLGISREEVEAADAAEGLPIRPVPEG